MGQLLEDVRELFLSESPLPAKYIVVAVEGVPYIPAQVHGDFGQMLELPEYRDALFVFNDNERQFKEHLQHAPASGICVAGGGNAKIRPWQCLADPQVAGVPTGDGGGYASLTPHVHEVVEEAMEKIKDHLATGRFRRVFFNEAPDGLIATGIFKVDDAVRRHVTDSLRALAQQ